MKKLLFIICLLLAINVSSKEIMPFLKSYCYDCHDEDIQKGGVRLDNMSKDLSDISTLKKWVLIHDMVKTGEMPPKKKKKQPSVSQKKSFLSALAPVLLKADLDRKEVVLRRLNRQEIQNTVNDLFYINLDLKHLLPEDSITAGFDNVGSGMSISTELMESYMDFADNVVEHAIVTFKKPKIINKTFNYKDIPRVQKNSKRIRTVKDGVVLYHTGDYSSTTLYEFRANFRGKYRIKIKYGSYNNKENRALKLRVFAGNFSIKSQWGLQGYFDVPVDRGEIVIEPYLRRNETLRIVPYNTGVAWLKDAMKETRAGIWIGDVHVEGPLLESWPVKSTASVFKGVDMKSGTRLDAQMIIKNFLPRAFRRPVNEQEVQAYLSLFDTVLEKSKSFTEGIKVVLKAALCSADFIFLVEKGQGRLTDYELANRLSYFLWSSLPDKELTDLAAKGQLQNPQTLKNQTERMLSDPKAKRFVENFTGQWLKLRSVDETVPDKKLYPEYDEFLRDSLVRETELFFSEILKKDLSLVNFIDSDFLILNDRMAEHYGIPGIKGSDFRKVKVSTGSPRGGVLTQASIMKVTANGTDTSPILRGVWILENIMGAHVPPPPPAVPAVEPDIRGTVTIREQLDAHKSNKSCFGCHSKIDPVGFAFENFDPVGTFRDYYRTIGGKGKHAKTDSQGRKVRYRIGPDVDSSGVLKEGSKFSNIKEFKQILLKQKDVVALCLTDKLMTYATGRVPGFSDRAMIQDVALKTKQKNYGLKTLIHNIVQSEIFKNH